MAKSTPTLDKLVSTHGTEKLRKELASAETPSKAYFYHVGCCENYCLEGIAGAVFAHSKLHARLLIADAWDKYAAHVPMSLHGGLTSYHEEIRDIVLTGKDNDGDWTLRRVRPGHEPAMDHYTGTE